MYDHYGNPFGPFRQRPLELEEIADKITSGKPSINWDDILDFFLELNKKESELKIEETKAQCVTRKRR